MIHPKGQNFVAIDSIFNITEPMKKAGGPVDSHFSTEDPTPIWPLMGAVFKEAPHPNAGMLFMAWLTVSTRARGGGHV
jgi:ABC-type Fe3+ transport system substrate-binding protein